MPTYNCTGDEAPGNANLYKDGVWFNCIYTSRCYADYYCEKYGYTWDWRDGIDPDDPTTWPGYIPPEDPPAEPEE